MFNIGGGEMMLLAILALLVFGPEGLPEIIKTVTRTVRGFRQAASDFQAEVSTALTVENQKRDVEQRRRRRSAPTGETPALAQNATPVEGETSTEIQAESQTSETAMVVQSSQALVLTEASAESLSAEQATSSPPATAVEQPGPATEVPPSAHAVAQQSSAHAVTHESTDPIAAVNDSTPLDLQEPPSSAPSAELAQTETVPATPPAPSEDDDDGPGLPMVKKPPVVLSDSEPSPSLESVS